MTTDRHTSGRDARSPAEQRKLNRRIERDGDIVGAALALCLTGLLAGAAEKVLFGESSDLVCGALLAMMFFCVILFSHLTRDWRRVD